MTDQHKSEHDAHRDTTDEGQYADEETASGRETHKPDVVPGEYTDSDLGDKKD
ncbi:hypothetical protein [Microbacterium sp. CJ88]|uniref:hypothetical protein n=1 Tax=Microbacterium sp. CJ88 TaxID=3445672 RepID=UPI003F65FB76